MEQILPRLTKMADPKFKYPALVMMRAQKVSSAHVLSSEMRRQKSERCDVVQQGLHDGGL